MCSLSMMEDKLPPGFRFHPKDEELICDYLQKKISGEKIESSSEIPMVIEVDLNKCEPWDIPDVACVGGKDWYFFSLRDRKYATGLRTNRATVSGYWKATGKDRQVTRKSKLVGMRKTLVFYQGRAPKGRKTDWVMHEFRVEDGNSDPCQLSKKEDWVLCKVFCKNRSISANTIEDFGFNDTSCSTSTYLPPLIDIFAVFDEKTPINLEEECEQQVAFLPKLPSFSQIENHEPKTNFCQYVHLSDFHSGLNPFSFENDSIKTVLGNFSKLEKVLKMEEMPRLTEIGSESFLSDDDAISIWETI